MNEPQLERALRIASLIKAQRKGVELSAPETSELQQWRQENESHETLYQQLSDVQMIAADLEQMDSHDPEAAKLRLTRKITRPGKLHFMRWAAAAAILAAVAVTAVWLLQSPKPEMRPVTAQVIRDIQPGARKAYVTLGNGNRVVLDDVKAGEQVGNAVKTADGKLVYQSSASQAVTYNTVTVPRGGVPQFVELPDHSQVWVNTESSITYATAFTGTIRKVEMTGEVYFEVAKNGKPFVVQTRTDRIEVMGTHFNINSYSDEAAVKTTLLEGKVRVGNAVLAPNEQYANGKVVRIDAVAMQRVMAWKNGLFSYDKVDVQTLMRDLGRYYDMEVVFEGMPTRRTFEGEIGRSLSLKEVLDGLHFTELNYRLEKTASGNRIVMLPE